MICQWICQWETWEIGAAGAKRRQTWEASAGQEACEAERNLRICERVVTAVLEDYLGSAQLWKSATIASHRNVVSTLAGDPLCRLL